MEKHGDDQKKKDMIKEFGWMMDAMIIQVDGEPRSNIHTHGVEETWGHKDFQIVLLMHPGQAHAIFSAIIEEIKKGKTFSEGERYGDIIENFDITFKAMQEDGREVLRVILPDFSGKLPGLDEEVDEFFQMQVRELDFTPELKEDEIKIHAQLPNEFDGKRANYNTEGLPGVLGHLDLQITLPMHPLMARELLESLIVRIQEGETYEDGDALEISPGISLGFKEFQEGARRVIRIILPDVTGVSAEESDDEIVQAQLEDYDFGSNTVREEVNTDIFSLDV